MPEVNPQGSLQEVVSLSFSQSALLIIIYSSSLAGDISAQVSSACYKIFPLENVLVRKVKVLKKPKFDLTKLMELYSSKADAVRPIETPAAAAK